MYLFNFTRCNTTEYKISLTHSRFSSEIYLDSIKDRSAFKSEYDEKEIDLEALEEDIVKLNIFYESELYYTEMDESIYMDLVSLFAEIGG